MESNPYKMQNYVGEDMAEEMERWRREDILNASISAGAYRKLQAQVAQEAQEIEREARARAAQLLERCKELEARNASLSDALYGLAVAYGGAEGTVHIPDSICRDLHAHLGARVEVWYDNERDAMAIRAVRHAPKHHLKL